MSISALSAPALLSTLSARSGGSRTVPATATQVTVAGPEGQHNMWIQIEEKALQDGDSAMLALAASHLDVKA